MSEKPSALSTIAPQPQAEGEYDLICATMAESARGRWFLDEYARRNRNTDTALVLAAIERIEAVIRGEREQQAYQSFRGDLLDMAKAIAQTRAEVAAIEPEATAPVTRPDAPPVTAPANRDIFAAAERIQDVAWTMRDRGLDPRICQQIEALVSSILLASSLRNPDDHRPQKLGEVLHYLERRISAMLDACAEPAPGLAEESAPAEEGAVVEVSTDPASTYQASPDEEVEAASAPLHGGNGHDAGGGHAVTVPDQETPAAQMAEALDLPQSSAADPAIEEDLIEEDLIEEDLAAPVASVTMTAVPPEEAVASPPAEIVAAPIETEPRHDPAASTAVRATIPQIDIEPLVVLPVAWRKTPAEEPPAQLEHAPIVVEPLFPEQPAEAPAAAPPAAEAPAAAVESTPAASPQVEMTVSVATDPVQPAEATASPIFRPPEAAVVFLVEYPTTATEDARMGAATVTAASVLDALPPPAMTHLPERPAPVAAPEAFVERSAVMMADIDKEPFVPAPADTAAPPPQYSLPPAEPIPQPVAAPAAPPPATAASAPSDPLAALRAMSPEERIALFT